MIILVYFLIFFRIHTIYSNIFLSLIYFHLHLFQHLNFCHYLQIYLYIFQGEDLFINIVLKKNIHIKIINLIIRFFISFPDCLNLDCSQLLDPLVYEKLKPVISFTGNSYYNSLCLILTATIYLSSSLKNILQVLVLLSCLNLCLKIYIRINIA